MAGRIKVLVDTIIEKRANGDEVLMRLTRVKMLCKGIDPNNYTLESDDDMNVIKKLECVASEIGVTI